VACVDVETLPGPAPDAGPATPNDESRQADAGVSSDGGGGGGGGGGSSALPDGFVVPTACERGSDCGEESFCVDPIMLFSEGEIEVLEDEGHIPKDSWVCTGPEFEPCYADGDCELGSFCAPGAELYYGLAWDYLVQGGFPEDGGSCFSYASYAVTAADLACIETGVDGCEEREGCALGSACTTAWVDDDPAPDPYAEDAPHGLSAEEECPGYFMPICLEELTEAPCVDDAECGEGSTCDAEGLCQFIDGWCADDEWCLPGFVCAANNECELDPDGGCATDADCAEGEACYETEVCFDEDGADCITTALCESLDDVIDLVECANDEDCTVAGEECMKWDELLTPDELQQAEQAGQPYDVTKGLCLDPAFLAGPDAAPSDEGSPQDP
jgi:hypothetical protein